MKEEHAVYRRTVCQMCFDYCTCNGDPEHEQKWLYGMDRLVANIERNTGLRSSHFLHCDFEPVSEQVDMSNDLCAICHTLSFGPRLKITMDFAFGDKMNVSDRVPLPTKS